MPNLDSLTKCRRLYYNKLTGEVMGCTAGGGASEGLTGDDHIDYQLNDRNAHLTVGLIEEYYTPIPARKAIKVDLQTVQTCHDAVAAHRTAMEDLSQFVWEASINASESPTTQAILTEGLKIAEFKTRNEKEAHDAVVAVQKGLEEKIEACIQCMDDCCAARDAVITFRDHSEPRD